MPNPDFIQFQVRQGLEADLPVLALGEIGFSTDTGNFYVGGSSGNVLVGSLYSPATPSNWSGTPPATVKQALDRISSLVASMHGGPIP